MLGLLPGRWLLAAAAVPIAIGLGGLALASWTGSIRQAERASVAAELAEQRREMAAARHEAVAAERERLYAARQREAGARLEFRRWRDAQADDGCVLSPGAVRELQSLRYPGAS